MYVSYHQDYWNTWLPLAEFSYNNSDHSSTKQSPFFTVYGRDPQFDSAQITQETRSGKLSTKIQSVQQEVKRELEASIKRFKRPTKKLFERWLGPFPILKKISTHAYHLKLSSQWKSIHPDFHISLLQQVKTSTILKQHQEPPPPIIIEKEEECQMSREDQVNLNSHANTFISSNFSFNIKTSGIPTFNPSQQPQQPSTLSWCSGAHH
ncbi:hypothetical protein O181_070959 [Austropuccinia psidii MF-1]|uniref:Tf2-1-like SH3-like domain-containing protein n=1 Tax=Austropuccinia psidii MF-1 TaxID=1389203 RepID=A0A9Q3F2B7_9BASI|nr:hypothetical protein [Austropuccinia psidii MF-1]